MIIKNIMIVLTAVFSLHISATEVSEKKFDKDRYILLSEGLFDDKVNDFSDQYVYKPELIDLHIETIKQHKKQKEEELADRKFTLETSWRPLILKMVGGIFGSSALSLGSIKTIQLLSAFELINPSKFLLEILAFPLLYMGPGYITRPILSPIYDKLIGLYDRRDISLAQLTIADFGLQIGRTLLFAGIAKYLFNKASSYANEIKKIEKIIARDEKMITALEKIKESKSEK